MTQASDDKPSIVPGPSRVPFLLALAVTCLGLVVMAVWYADYAPLIGVQPSFPPMMFNAALLFTLSGLGLVAFYFRQPRLTLVFGMTVAVFALLTLTQYLFGVDLGLDQLLMRDVHADPSRVPGRMAPNTALAFMLSGIALMAVGTSHRHPHRHALIGILGALVAALALVSAFGYASGIPTAYAWGHAIGMAAHAALGLLLLGGCFIAYAWRADCTADLPLPHWLPLMVGIGVLAMVVAVWQALHGQERMHIERLVQRETVLVRNEMTMHLDERVQALVRMARRLGRQGGLRLSEWKEDADLYLRHDSSYQAIAWLEPEYQVRAAAWAGAAQPELYPDADRGRTRPGVSAGGADPAEGIVLRTLRASTGADRLLIDAPIVRRGRTVGYARGVFRLPELFTAVLSADSARGYGIAVRDGGREIFSRSVMDERHVREWGRVVQLKIHGARWEVQVWPTPELLAETKSYVPEVLLVFGSLLALILALAVRYAQQSWLRARQLDGANRQLLAEIDAHRRDREALAKSERDYRALMDQASDGIVLADTAGNLLDANTRFQEMTGYASAEIRRLHARELFPPEDIATRPMRFAEVLAGQSVIVERPLRRKDGATLPVEISVKRIGDRLQAVFRDLSERKQAEALTLRLGRMLDSSSNEFYAFDALSLRFVQASQAALANLGYTLEELQQLTPLDIEPEFNDQGLAVLLEPLRAGRKNRIVFETLHRRKDGSPYQAEVRLQLLLTENPPVFVAVVQDITERKQTEVERHKLARAVEQTADPVIITDLGGIVEYVNPAFERVTGYERDEILGRTPSVLRSGRHDDDFYRRLWETILGGATFREVFINRRKDGTLYYEEKTITPLKDGHGRITHFISTGKDITEHLHVQERLQHLSQHDVLTQLPNRALFTQRLVRAIARARTQKGRLAVLYLDLDRFGVINDSLGQVVADSLLKAAAERIRECARENDTVARLGGDEFGVLLDGVASPKEASLLAQKILLGVAMPYQVSGHELFVTTSIGISLYPGDGADATALIANADAAMASAKKHGKNALRFYEKDMNLRMTERFALETSLRGALERKEFLLHYQPQMDLRTGRVCGIEALLRWHSPERGLVEPGSFLPILEETGLIAPVGVWILRTACEQARAWQATGLLPLPVTVKVSDREVADLDYADIVGMVLAETGLEPRLLHLEIGHRLLSGEPPGTDGMTRVLRDLGVPVTIGGFDVGAASLGQLKQMNAAALKIAGGFVRSLSDSPEDVSLLRAIVAIAHQMQLRVIAEGVEHDVQLRLLRAADCDAIQGLVFSRPLTAIEVTRFVQRPQPPSLHSVPRE